jgi:glycerate kinase
VSATVLVAPDSFKGTFSARAVADAIAAGLERMGLVADRCPVADGGEGTLDALLPRLSGALRSAPAHDPLGRPLEATFGLSGDGETAIVEAAAASGLGLVAEPERDAWAASTAGTGELIAAAVAAGARTVLVAAGGSATTDGGAGALEAIAQAGGIGSVRIVVLCDVRVPFEQAAEVFGPQKGADAAMVAALTRRLHEQAEGFARDPRGVPMSGCAGGLSGALWAQLDATLAPGAGWVLDALSVDARLRAARAAITGEGRLDAQTATGKLIAELVSRARNAGVPAHAIVGTSAAEPATLEQIGLASVREATTLAEIEAAAATLAPSLA